MSVAGTPSAVAFFGHFGSANPGNESTLVAILTRLRELNRGAEFRCICSDPAAVAARDGIKAVPITTRPHRIWDRSLPLGKRAAMVCAGLSAELREYARAYRFLKGAKVLIVPGTGLVTDAYGLARWGPYNLFKWMLVAKLRHAKVLFVSVGAGPIDGRAGRLLVKAALSLADYRSYRDQASKGYLTRIGFDTSADPVYPDLVFGLSEALLPTQPAPAPAAPVVGLGLMVYAERYSTRNPREQTYSSYLESLADFAVWLLDGGYRIRLLLGDSDTIVIEHFRDALARRGGVHRPAALIEQPIRSIDDVLNEIAACDAVVATRFHNVLMAMLLNKPVIAISFHHKCSSLMQQMRVSEYCHDIHRLDTQRLIEQFQKLERNRATVKATLDQGVGAARSQLDEQYDRLFAAA